MSRPAVSLVLSLALIVAGGPAVGQSGKKQPSVPATGDAAATAPAAPDLPACGRFPSGAETHACLCPPDFPQGSVWGSGPYTGDSDVCTAARHAGVIGEGGGAVRLLARPGQDSYQGSAAHGVTTRDWGSYRQSYVFEGAPEPETRLVACGVMPEDAGDLACRCDADPPVRSVWGNGPYTADSDICTAARHAGYIEAAGGEVYVLRIRGLDVYFGSEANGVTSGDWGAYRSSIVFDWNR